jgi:drug/metabolite transporter (DMT)-like permease
MPKQVLDGDTIPNRGDSGHVPIRSIPILAVGLVALSSAAPLIRLAHAPAIVIAAYRMTLSAFLLSPLFWATWSRRRMEFVGSPALAGWSAVSGVFLALHFAFWIESLNHTSVTSSVLLVTMNPIFLAIASPLFLKEKLCRRMMLAILVGLTGAVVITLKGGDAGLLSAASRKGNLLALAGAVMYSGYLLLGRRVRQRVSILSYVYVTYTIAALILLAAVALFRLPLFGYSRTTYLYLGMLAVLPQLLGHSSFNWALKHVSAPAVSLVILGEPIGASLIAWWILHQAPTRIEVLGGILVLAGIALAGSERRAAQVASHGAS